MSLHAWGAERRLRAGPCSWESNAACAGSGRRSRRARCRGGAIPACAGSSRSLPRWRCGRRVHPRVRGEQFAEFLDEVQPEGPSPRARGAATGSELSSISIGPIPACAGSSGRRSPIRPGRRVHPRVRGEQSVTSAPVYGAGGPSPRARGAGGGEQQSAHDRGSIPACAGSSTRPRTPRPSPRVHPRVRGEQTRGPSDSKPRSGPSPRARGAARSHQPGERDRGSIPACAGSSPTYHLAVACDSVHPRVRGEQEQSPRRPA